MDDEAVIEGATEKGERVIQATKAVRAWQIG